MKPKIREVKETDFEKMLRIYQPYVEKTTVSFEEAVPSIAEYSQRLKTMLMKYPVLVVELDNEVVGYAYAHAFRDFSAYDKVAEITIYLKEDLASRGLGSLLYAELETRLANQGIEKVIACITSDNHGSVKFHEKNGYRYVGEFKGMGYKFDQWLDVIWLEKGLK